MPLKQELAQQLIAQRHTEWREHQREWRRLYDSLEGGERYRRADYVFDPTAKQSLTTTDYGWSNFGTPLPRGFGTDPTTGRAIDISYGQIVNRNLIPHLSETTPEGRDLYMMRLERTPVPAFVRLAIQTHLSRIYSREVRREAASPAVQDWWKDADGKGTTIDRWMTETVAPLLLLMGQLDIAVTNPPAPEGFEVQTKADQAEAGLADAVASIVLPENVINWELTADGKEYRWCVICERHDSNLGFRHWTDTDSDFYNLDGEWIKDRSWQHNLGWVPIRRFFDQRKPRCGNIGVSDYEQIADRSRAFYNIHSEVIMAGVFESHPRLQGPEDYLNANADIPTGPGNVLPMRASMDKGSYSGWSYLDPPQSAQESLRSHLKEIADQIDRLAGLSKPAGAVVGSTVAQSGVSKIMDGVDGNALLAKKADTVQACEIGVAEMVLRLLGQPIEDDSIKVIYPRQFDPYTAADLAQALDDIARIASGMGALPVLQAELLDRLVTLYLPGLPDEKMAEIRAEIMAKVAEAAAAHSFAPADLQGMLPDATTPQPSGPAATNDGPSMTGPDVSQQAVDAVSFA